MSFVSLHNHSEYSNTHLLDCIIKPNDLINKALQLGYAGIALTDHDCLSGAVNLLKIRDKIKEEHPDFKIIFGNEIYLIDQNEIKNAEKYYHFIILAKDREGWEQLKQLSSRAWERSYFEKGVRRTPTTYQDIEEIVGGNPGHLLCSTACLGSRIAHCILKHEVKEANNFVRWCIQNFGQNNVALELQPSDSEEQITVNKVLVKFARYYSLPFIVTTDSHYLNKEDFNVHSAFINSRSSSDRESEKFYRFTYVMSMEEIKSLLSLSMLTEQEIQEAIDNTSSFTKDIIEFDFRQPTIIPAPDLPQFQLEHSLKVWYDKYECIKYYAYSKYDQDRYLLFQIERGIKNKKIQMDDIKAERINTELDVLRYISEANDQPMSGYLNLVRKIEQIIWKTSIIGVSRGSAMSFYINYLIGLIQANPLEYDVAYWRFLNKARSGAGNFPDVDIDVVPSQTDTIMKLLRESFGEDKVINCITFKTESLKSAVLTSCRGCQINNDEAQALASLVPVSRGKVYSLQDCLVGNEDLGYVPAPEFINKLKSYPNLFETVQKIEGLISGAGIHASCVYITKEPFQKYVSCMRAPNGTLITALNMSDVDCCGVLKFDLLRTDAEEKIMKCMNILLSQKEIEWQGSLYATYYKYLHPDNLIYDNPEMWRKAADGEITSLFQFDTPVGEVCIKKTRPENVRQMGAANAVMRLQAADGEEAPIDRYVRFRNDISNWYQEMGQAGVNSQEVKVLEKYLLHKFGCAVEQEDLMLLLMDPEIANFSLKQADHARKIIAKKKMAEIGELKELFFTNNIGKVRKVFLQYVWDKCIQTQIGYSFSVPHDIGYSLIALQEMNLVVRWNPLYWQCACLCINAGNFSSDFDEINENKEENGEIDVDKENQVQEKKVAPEYGKISKAISDAQLAGVKIELPDINNSQLDFVPDVKNNSILYSLQAINVVSSDLLDRILNNRPFTSLQDFCNRVQPSQIQMLGLIKAGCFDKLEGNNRNLTVLRYLQQVAGQQFPLKDKITSVQLKKALELGLQLEGYLEEIRMFKFKQYIDKNQLDKTTNRYILSEPSCLRFFHMFVQDKLNITKDEYGDLPDNKIFMKISAFKRVSENAMKKLMDYLNSLEGRKAYQQLLQENFIRETKAKYCEGNIAHWEFDTACCYFNEHELQYVNEGLYNVRDFNKLPEISIDKKLCTVLGTVVSSNNTRHTVSLLTKYGIVDVKFYSSSYTNFNQRISVVDPVTKKKTVLDESWFKRGSILIVAGNRNENLFTAKNDYSSGVNRGLGKVEKINKDGTLEIRYSRKRREK